MTQNTSYIKLWFHFSANILDTSVTTIIEFLRHLFDKGFSYPQICMARSAVSALVNARDDVPIGKHPLLKRFMKGIFELRPVFPKYHTTWDLSILFNYFRSMDYQSKLSIGKKAKS